MLPLTCEKIFHLSASIKEQYKYYNLFTFGVSETPRNKDFLILVRISEKTSSDFIDSD